MLVHGLVDAVAEAQGVVDGADGGRDGVLGVGPGCEDTVAIAEPLIAELVPHCLDAVVGRHFPGDVIVGRIIGGPGFVERVDFALVPAVTGRGLGSVAAKLRGPDEGPRDVDKVSVMSAALRLLGPGGGLVERVVQRYENVAILRKKRKKITD